MILQRTTGRLWMLPNHNIWQLQIIDPDKWVSTASHQGCTFKGGTAQKASTTQILSLSTMRDSKALYHYLELWPTSNKELKLSLTVPSQSRQKGSLALSLPSPHSLHKWALSTRKDWSNRCKRTCMFQELSLSTKGLLRSWCQHLSG